MPVTPVQDATLEPADISSIADDLGMNTDDVADVVQQSDTSDRGKRRHQMLLQLAILIQAQAS